MAKGKTVNPGVKCEVEKCEHHMTGDMCDAKEVQIQPRGASAEQQTDCSTFKPDEQMM